ncbi:hypothetical protein AV521_36695 [Streptomyces sp. IMTB 2501]|uniref:hypothetical protein n=1 Tax=Streptomyces sp. IMTB 2501 TaxID=1776340 RepID=UPI00096E1775|nr:hypothetical protein [Streptomyces sp. IMTB 2501]OLZ64078.1 hypothetical protein AV521_36695 [Streptomyces sp. IMTB 2501]
MANPVILLLAITLLVVLVVGHGVLVTLPRLVWAQLHTVWRTFGRAAQTPPDPQGEPAIPAYLRVTGPRDLRATWWDGLEQHERLMGDAERFVVGRVSDAFRSSQRGGTRGQGCLMVFLRPAFLLTAVAVVLTATALSILPLLFALLVWALSCALWSLWWAVGAAVARTGRALRGWPAPCPYTDCGRTIDRPVRLCPTCRARHRQLVPGRYGVFHHRCRCGTRLPAVLGGRRLDACCPHCGKALPAGCEQARVVVLVGGSATQRAGVHRQGLAELGATPGIEPPLVRTAGTPVLWYDPPGDAYGSQESAAALDVLRRAHGLLLVVDDPAAHSDAVHAVIRVLHVLTALPPRLRPHRLALLYTQAVRDDATAVRAQLDEAGGGHLLRALDATRIPVRCVPAAALAGTVRWLAGTAGTAGSGESMAPPPVGPPENTTFRFPRHRIARHTLLLAHLAGYVVIPFALVLLQTGALPPSAFFGLPAAYDKWQHPLTSSVHQVDLTAAATRDWPQLSASYSAPGHPPSAALPGHGGYWSVKGSPRKDNWLRVDFGMPLPLSEVSVDFDPDSVTSIFSPGADVEGQVGTRTVTFPSGHPHEKQQGTYLTKEYGFDDPVPEAVDSVRIGLGSVFDKDNREEQRLRLREFNIRWSSSDALRLHPTGGGGLTVENATARDLAITVRPPLLPAGWHATPVGRPPRILGAHDTYEARWRITAPKGTTGRAPVAYAVDITEDDHTVTARCLALLTASGAAEPLC